MIDGDRADGAIGSVGYVFEGIAGEKMGKPGLDGNGTTGGGDINLSSLADGVSGGEEDGDPGFDGRASSGAFGKDGFE